MKLNLAMIAQLAREGDKHSLREIAEEDFQWAIVDYAKRKGYLVYYLPKSAIKTPKGWRGITPPGFFDLELIRAKPADFVKAELKSELGSPTPEQRAWLAAYLANGIEAHIWKPRHSSEILERLS